MMRRRISVLAMLVVYSLTCGACSSSNEKNLDEIRRQLQKPDEDLADLDEALARVVADAFRVLVPAIQILACKGFFLDLLQRFVDQVAPTQDGGVEDGGPSDGGDTIDIGHGPIDRFSGSVRIDTPCPGADGAFGTADDGSATLRGRLENSNILPFWRADFDQCTYPTDCGTVYANGRFAIDFGQVIEPGEPIPLDDLLVAYDGQLGETAATSADVHLIGRHRADGIDLVIFGPDGRPALLSVDEGGTASLRTRRGTWTCDFSADQCEQPGQPPFTW